MTSVCHLFITARNIDSKFLNRLYFNLLGWEYGPSDVFDYVDWVVNKRDAPDCSCGILKDPITTELPNNSWVGASIAEVESFFTYQMDRYKDWKEQSPYFMVVDEQGKRDGTCIFFERRDTLEWEDEPNELLKNMGQQTKFLKIRLPWDEAYGTWCNLDIANMDFEDFTDHAPADKDGWLKYRSCSSRSVEGFAERDRRIRASEERFDDIGAGA